MQVINNFIGLGDLVLDIYHNEKAEVLYSVGGSVWNDLLNINSINESSKVYAIATCGNDSAGRFVKDSLGKLNINVDNVTECNYETKRFNLILNSSNGNTISQLKCPKCGEHVWYSNSKLPGSIPKDLEKVSPGIVIIDNLKKNTLFLVNLFREKGWFIACDIGHISYLRYLKQDMLSSLLQNQFDFIQITKKVESFLLKKLNIINSEELIRYFSSKYLIVTEGEKGSTVLELRDNVVEIVEADIIKTIALDTAGAGDAFFSMFLSSINKTGDIVGSKLDLINRATLYASERVSVVGANNYLVKSVNFDSDYLCDSCGRRKNINLKKKTKKRKVVVTNTNYLKERVIKSLNTDATDQLKVYLTDLKGRIFMVGTGGSFTSALFGAKVVNSLKTSACAYAIKPRDMIMEQLRPEDRVLLFSYSGRSKDIIKVYNKCKSENISVKIITLLDRSFNKMEYDSSEIISYNSADKMTKERGFISMAGTIIPMCIFAQIFFDNENIKFTDILENIFSHWEQFTKNCNEIDKLSGNNLLVDIFTGNDSICAGNDLESKLVESGLARVSFHEKKDFSHGRFNIIETMPSNIVFFFSNTDGEYSKKLLNYLENRENTNICEMSSALGYVWGDLDLTIGVQFILKAISESLDFDMSRPDYPKEAMKLYKYSGKDIL